MPDLSKDLKDAIIAKAEKKKKDSYQIDAEIEAQKKKIEAERSNNAIRAVVADEEENEPEELGSDFEVQNQQQQNKNAKNNQRNPESKQDVVESPRRKQALEAIARAKANPTENFLKDINNTENVKKLNPVRPSEKQNNNNNLQISQELRQIILDKVNALNPEDQDDAWKEDSVPSEKNKQETSVLKKKAEVDQSLIHVAVVSAETPKVEAPKQVQVQKVESKQAEVPKVESLQAEPIKAVLTPKTSVIKAEIQIEQHEKVIQEPVKAQQKEPKQVEVPKAENLQVREVEPVVISKTPVPKVEVVKQPEEAQVSNGVAEKIKFFESSHHYDIANDTNRKAREAEMNKVIPKNGVQEKIAAYENHNYQLISDEKTKTVRDERNAEIDKVVPKSSLPGELKVKDGVKDKIAIYENPITAAKLQIQELVSDADLSKADPATLLELAGDIQTRGLVDLERSKRSNSMRKQQERLIEPEATSKERNKFAQENADYLLALQLQQQEVACLCVMIAVTVCAMQQSYLTQQAFAVCAFRVAVVQTVAVQQVLFVQASYIQQSMFHQNAKTNERNPVLSETENSNPFRPIGLCR